MFKFDEESHTYTLGNIRLPSVTEICAPLQDFSGVPEHVLERKQAIGVAVHKACELINTGLEVDSETVHEACRGYIQGFEKFRELHPFDVLMSEKQLHSERYLYAGTLDFIARMRDRNALLWSAGDIVLFDIKTVAQLSVATAVQTAGYRIVAAQELRLPISTIKRAALQLKPDGAYVVKAYNSATDEPCFLSLLNTLNWRIKNDRTYKR
jgi:hypothetical protein